jgi:hypothetical protein
MTDSTNIITGDFGELRIETQMIDVTSSLPRPDKSWTYTDEHGHEHRYDDGYPTLVRVVDATRVDEDGEEWEESHLECRECGEHIAPRMTGPSRFREYAPGRIAAYLNGEPISKERYLEIVEQYSPGG